jgi:predicted RNase H-like nuclease (RuvC/YqgF family)
MKDMKCDNCGALQAVPVTWKNLIQCSDCDLDPKDKQIRHLTQERDQLKAELDNARDAVALLRNQVNKLKNSKQKEVNYK